MTSSEFSAARQRLGWTPIDAAVEYNVTPNVIETFEEGSVKIPKGIALDIRFRSAMRERDEVLAASGLPECSEKEELIRARVGETGRALIAASNAFVAHVKSCTLCRERREYADRHGPALPVPPVPAVFRIAIWSNAQLNRLPLAIRPPEGKAGEGRRIGFLMGAALSAFACLVALLRTIDSVTRVGVQSGSWEVLVELSVIIVMYFVGFYVAGWVWDALRPIHDRFIGYVLRFGLAGVAIYGAVAVAMPFLDEDHMSLNWSLEFVASVGGFWALLGAGLWVKDRFWGKLAKR